ncbi:cell division protein ZapB [Telmatospirillum sp.]|uniref:cell division protein ZapB n=1 Tax=Telmatospirillum sp. TaxID=2079197 RepID=UPI0028467457|nr:cell division protein ZapB [Telmatospirillum sp.]MDR3437156.1 cell division protein ZapB [Telmatospirillum sp.]
MSTKPPLFLVISEDDTMNDDTPKVVTMADFRPSVRRKAARYNTCRHTRIMIDTEHRLLECRDCGAVVEPIEYLMKCAVLEESVYATVQQLRKEVEELKAERASLASERNQLLLGNNRLRRGRPE